MTSQFDVITRLVSCTDYNYNIFSIRIWDRRSEDYRTVATTKNTKVKWGA